MILDAESKPVFETFQVLTTDEEKDIMEDCFDLLAYVERVVKNKLSKCADMTFNLDDKAMFDQAEKCYVCEKGFSETLLKVRDHCHYTGNYRGAACSQCNLKMRQVEHLPIFVHNFINYDGIFITKGLEYVKHPSDISGIPQNSEKIKSVSIGALKFVDSLEFLRGSLSQIVESAQKSDLRMFDLLFELKLCSSQRERDLLLRKGVFPYDFFSSIDVMKRATSLPPRECFYNQLKNEAISEEDYAHAREVFEVFNCGSMLDYLKLYNRLDTALLGIAFQNYRKIFWQDFNLDPAHYLSTPMLAMDCFLKSSKIAIELLYDVDMVLIAMNNIRGGLSQANTRYVSVQPYNASSSKEHLLYIDANNLYGFAMCQNLPLADYAFLSREEIEKIDWLKLSTSDPRGYIIEADLEYPPLLHKRHEDLPLIFQNRNISLSQLSEYSKACLKLSGLSGNSYKARKLCADFEPKERIAVHYLNLKFYLSQGIILKKIHSVISFRQESFIDPYIRLMAQKRKNAKDSFHKNFLKLCANALYGKFLQNDRHHRNVRFLSDGEKSKNVIARREYISHRIFSENLIAVFMRKQKVKLNKCYLIGFSILELSKLHMLSSYHCYIRPFLGEENVSLVLTDTDSYVLHVKNMTRLHMLKKLSPLMDFSNYPPQHPMFSTKHKGELGFFKDENAGECITEIIALRSKCYAMKTQNDREYSRCKGVSHSARKDMNFETYRTVLTEKKVIRKSVKNIVTQGEKVVTIEQNKVALCPFDDKRFILKCGIHTRPYGTLSKNERCETCDIP